MKTVKALGIILACDSYHENKHQQHSCCYQKEWNEIQHWVTFIFAESCDCYVNSEIGIVIMYDVYTFVYILKT